MKQWGQACFSLDQQKWNQGAGMLPALVISRFWLLIQQIVPMIYAVGKLLPVCIDNQIIRNLSLKWNPDVAGNLVAKTVIFQQLQEF